MKRVLVVAVVVGAILGAVAGAAGAEDRRCTSDAQCTNIRKDRSYICALGYCQLGCRSDDVCVQATGNRLAQCVPVKGCKPLKDAPCHRDCVLPAWSVP
jgi:hypothetical protein